MTGSRTCVVKIPKRNGSYRTIFRPTQEYKTQLRGIVGRLERKARNLDRDNVVHGFMRYRSPVTMAQAHVNHRFTLSMDLKDFFDHVTDRTLAGKLSKEELALVLEDGAARQGLPSSPAVANIAFADCDKAIIKFVRKTGKNVVYTRYADDMVFSFDVPGVEVVLERAVREIIGRAGFKLNEKKTHYRTQSAVAGS